MVRALLMIVALLWLTGCPRKFDEEAWKARGAEAVAPFKQQLKAALVEGLAESPQAAIATCRIEAPEIARAASTEGVKVGRASHKLRNPENRAKDWMTPLIGQYLGGATEPRAVVIDEQTVGYVEPIVLQPLCVTCHGTAIPAAIEAGIAELYPSDEATGFQVGDFRGVFWAELKR